MRKFPALSLSFIYILQFRVRREDDVGIVEDGVYIEEEMEGFGVGFVCDGICGVVEEEGGGWSEGGDDVIGRMLETLEVWEC